MLPAFPLLEKNRHDSVAVAQPAACIVVHDDAAFADLFGGNAVILRPVAEFLITTFAIYEVDINGMLIDERLIARHYSAGNFLRARTARGDHLSYALYQLRCPC